MWGWVTVLLTCVTNLKDVIQDLNRDETAEEHEEAPVRDEEGITLWWWLKG